MSSLAQVSVSKNAVVGGTIEVDVVWPDNDKLALTPKISVKISQDGVTKVQQDYNSKSGTESYYLTAPNTVGTSVLVIEVDQTGGKDPFFGIQYSEDNRTLYTGRSVVTIKKTGNDTTNDDVDVASGDQANAGTKSMSDYLDEYLGDSWPYILGGGAIVLIATASVLHSGNGKHETETKRK